MSGKHKTTGKMNDSTHVRVEKADLQRLRQAVVFSGGSLRGSLSREASIALSERARKMLANAPEGVRKAIFENHSQDQEAELPRQGGECDSSKK
jgi:hypothetical protein